MIGFLVQAVSWAAFGVALLRMFWCQWKGTCEGNNWIYIALFLWCMIGMPLIMALFGVPNYFPSDFDADDCGGMPSRYC